MTEDNEVILLGDGENEGGFSGWLTTDDDTLDQRVNDFASMVEFLLEREIITETMAHEWKSARRVTRK